MQKKVPIDFHVGRVFGLRAYLVDFQIRSSDDAKVTGYFFAGVEDADISRYKLLRRYFGGLTIADDNALSRHQNIEPR